MKLEKLEQLYKLEHVVLKFSFMHQIFNCSNIVCFERFLNHIASLVFIGSGGVSSSLFDAYV